MKNSYWEQAERVRPKGATIGKVSPTMNLRYSHGKLQQEVLISWQYNLAVWEMGSGDTHYIQTNMWMDIQEKEDNEL